MQERVQKLSPIPTIKFKVKRAKERENGKVEKGARKSFILPPQPASRLEKRNENMKQS